MRASEVHRAVAAAMTTASGLDLAVDDAEILSDSNRLVVRLTPCDAIARVAPPSALAPVAARSSWLSGPAYHARLVAEVDLAARLARSETPVGGLDERVERRLFEHDGFAISWWTYLEPARRPVTPAKYAATLERLHAGLREVDVVVPHVMDRLADSQHDVDEPEMTPDLSDADRAMLAGTLRRLTEVVAAYDVPQQVLHGEPHQWNLHNTVGGPVFMDFEDVVRGPVEWDLAWTPKDVAKRYPDADPDLIAHYRGIVLAIIAVHRWTHDDEHPSGRASGVALLDVLREGPPWRLPL